MIVSYLGLGSNMDDRFNNIRTALDMLSSEESNELLNISNLYESKAMYNKSLNNFYNAVAKIQTSLSASMLLSLVKNIEKKIGRIKSAERYANRPIDIDILSYGSEIIQTEELVIPHPHIKERKFVLKPWSDIDSNYIIVTENKKIKELLRITSDTSILTKVEQ